MADVCANCGKIIKTCCDIYEAATDLETGEEVLLCGECTQEVEGCPR